MPDLKQGRIYLPQEDLLSFGVSQEELAVTSEVPEHLVKLIHFEIDRAQSYYHRAWAGFPTERKKRRPLLSATLMGKIYESIMHKMQRDPTRIFREKVRLSTWKKMAVSEAHEMLLALRTIEKALNEGVLS